MLRKKLKPGRCYVTDRWFAQFTLFNEINAIGSSYVCRAKENSRFEVIEELVTNLLDAPAEIIALIYRYRWTIEVFFRFFKQTLGCRHLISQRVEGIQIHRCTARSLPAC
ncbi:MAG: transposase [Planctomycetota bacterium]|nr:transposase [Planctomycetota bacterium]